jgi:serine/threonine protein kinase
MCSYQLGEKLGRGSYATVYRARKGDSDFALKLFHDDEDVDLEETERVYTQEVEAFEQLDHPNVVKLFETNRRDYWLVFELLETDLHRLIYGKQPVSQETRINLFQQLLTGLAYVHEKGLVHRDLKPSNILVSSDMTLKIADFGSAVVVPEKGICYEHKVVTRWYRAPELIVKYPFYGQSIDMWSVGCIYVELWYTCVLFAGKSQLDQLLCIFRTLGTPERDDWPEVHDYLNERIEFGNRKSRIDELEQVDTEFLENLLCYNPSTRFTAQEALDAFNALTT